VDPRNARAVKTAIGCWLHGALQELKEHPEQIAELRKCFNANDGSDVRVIFHIKANALTIETLDQSGRIFCELFREFLTPSDDRFALPDADRKY
jgi:hypothetical protein